MWLDTKSRLILQILDEGDRNEHLDFLAANCSAQAEPRTCARSNSKVHGSRWPLQCHPLKPKCNNKIINSWIMYKKISCMQLFVLHMQSNKSNHNLLTLKCQEKTIKSKSSPIPKTKAIPWLSDFSPSIVFSCSTRSVKFAHDHISQSLAQIL